jgi:Right handed beta helix region
MRVKMTFAVLAITALALSLPASSTASRTVTVEAGESIQAAIDKAKPYTTIKIEAGTYAESLLIDKDGIELVGEGRKKTHIVPPANPVAGEGCADPTASPPVAPNGICVFDVDAQFNPVSTVEDVEISHLSVDGFEAMGIFLIHTRDAEVTRTILSNYGEYGVFANDSSGTKIARNVTYNSVDGVNPEAGIYIGDAPNADATVWKNVSWGNLLGVFARDAAHGKVLENKSFSNCVGILFLNTDAPVDVAHWLAKDNVVAANNRACPPGEEAPPLSGVGIAVLGGDDIDLIDNGVFGNKTAAGFESAFAGGIVVIASPFGPSPVPSNDIKVAFNTALGNDPDLFWDGAGNGNKFFANDCLTSQPDGLCDESDHAGQNGDGNGHHGDGNGHGDDDDHHGDKHHKKHKKHKGGKHSKHKNKKHFKHHDD